MSDLIQNFDIVTLVITLLFSGIFTYLQIKNQEKELKFKYNEYITTKRLESYPELIKITQDLGKMKINNKKLSNEELQSVIDNSYSEIKAWQVAPHGGYILFGKNAVEKFNKLKKKLEPKTDIRDHQKRDFIQGIWQARNEFRKAIFEEIGVMNRETIGTISEV